MEKLIIEARVNEYMMRDSGNPNVPYSAQEIADNAAACREAGAAVVHFHARQPSGAPAHGFEAYAGTVERIRAASDILIHPTLGYVTLNAPAAERLEHIMRMAKDNRCRPDFAPMDMGSVNVDKFNPRTGRFESEELIYQNSTGTLRYFAENIVRAGLKQYLVSWNVGFTRQILAFMDLGLIPEPAYLCFCMTDNTYLAGHPGTLKGLQAHIDFLPADKRIEWTVCNFGGNLFTLAATIIALGGHISIGLGDYPYPELGTPTNAELVRRIVEIAHEVGREVATPQEAKQILKMH